LNTATGQDQPHHQRVEPNGLGTLLLALLNLLVLMELSRQLLMEPASKGLLKEPAALFAGCSLESFRLNRGFSVRGNNDLDDFHAAPPQT
jgi:hypothetical protein